MGPLDIPAHSWKTFLEVTCVPTPQAEVDFL